MFSIYKLFKKKCALCCDDFNSDVFILPCKHVFDLQCFMTYVKFNYLEKKNKGSESEFAILCPICKVGKVESNTLDLFKKYKLILDMRLLIMKKYNILEQLSYERDNIGIDLIPPSATTNEKYTR